jgi:uncharacterized protein involved in type VI secretion and phage assembly
MTAPLYDTIARIARHESEARSIAAVGRVVEVFPAGGGTADHAVTVKLRDTGLVLPRVPVAVGVMGAAAIPAVDDLVVVVFLEGDLHGPVVLGRLYHPGQDPPEHAEGEVVLRLPSGTSSPKLNLVVAGDEPAVRFDLPGDLRVELTEGRAAVEVGAMHLVLEAAGGGRAEVSAGGSSIVLKQDGDVTVSAVGTLKLEGATVEVSGTAKVKVSGAVVEIN